MPRLAHQVLPAPQGYDSTNQSEILPPNRGVLLRNVLADRAGKLRASVSLHTLYDAFPDNPDGIAYYYGDEAADDRLLVVAGGLLWVGLPANPQTDPPTFHSWYVGGNGFTTGKKVRWAAYRSETFLVQEGGIQPKRFDGRKVYQLGIDAPANAPTVFKGTPSGGATAAKTGTINYAYTYFDSKFRESDLSDATEITFSSAAAGYVDIGDFGTDPQVHGAYIYATTSGGSTYYRIATLLRSGNTTAYEDNDADSTVNTGTTGPTAGKNAVPNEASCIAVNKTYLFLNDMENANVLQISNLDAPTQFASVTVTASDGSRTSIPTDQGDPVEALVPFGSLLGIFKRRRFYQLWGDTVSKFTLRPLHERGTIAPNSVTRCDNMVLALMEDGVYSMAWENGFLYTKVSQSIDEDLRSHTAAERERAEGAFLENRYYLAIGNRIYCYDLTPGAWVQIEK